MARISDSLQDSGGDVVHYKPRRSHEVSAQVKCGFGQHILRSCHPYENLRSEPYAECCKNGACRKAERDSRMYGFFHKRVVLRTEITGDYNAGADRYPAEESYHEKYQISG